MSNETVVLITGANRGLGLGLAKYYLEQPNTRVILTARNNASIKGLHGELLKDSAGKLHGIYQLESASTEDVIALRKSLISAEGVKKIDILIANAGIGAPFLPVSETPIEALETFFQVNTIGPIKLYQQLWKDLMENSEIPKFFVMSSLLGSVTEMDASPCGGYGASKAAANYLVRKIHLENEKLVAVSLHPGWVQTGNGQDFADAVNVEAPDLTIDESINCLVKAISESTREDTGGKLIEVMTGRELQF